jgi:hypothetical protein
MYYLDNENPYDRPDLWKFATTTVVAFECLIECLINRRQSDIRIMYTADHFHTPNHFSR